MIGYILGMTFGGLILAIAMSFLIYYAWKKRSIKRIIKRIGTAAEVTINNDIKIWAKHTKNKFIDANIFKYNKNKVFEVDSILITNKALIVIEIKSIKGGIEGSASAPKWQKVLGEAKHDITNPIIQNDRHISHIVKMTNEKIPTISLIIFSNRASYINVNGKPPHVVVTKHADIFDVLDNINKSLPEIMNDDEIKHVYRNIISHKTTRKQDIVLHKKITTGKGRV